MYSLQSSNAIAAATIIVGIDLGMPQESIDTSKRILTSLLTQTGNETRFGLVLADELVRTVIDPKSSEDLLTDLSGLPLEPGNSGNFSALLERSLAMADEAMANNAPTDTVKLWVISSGEIRLSAKADNTSKQTRFQMWASDILLPDIAERYPDFRMITPQDNSPEIIDAVTGYFGEAGILILPTAKSDVAPLVESLASVDLIVAISSSVSDISNINGEAAADADGEPIEQTDDSTANKNTDTNNAAQLTVATLPTARQIPKNIEANTGDKPEPLQLESSSTGETQEALKAPAPTVSNESIATKIASEELVSKEASTPTTVSDTTLTEQLERLAIEQTTVKLTTESESTNSLAPVATASITPVANTDTTSAIAISETESLKIKPEKITGSTATTIDPNVDDSFINKNRSLIILSILGAISILAMIFVALYRRNRHHQSKNHSNPPASASTITTAPESATQRSSTANSAQRSPATKPENLYEMIDAESETIVSEPATSKDAATVVTQASETNATVVNAPRQDQVKYLPDQGEDDFSAFDRSIIEKRMAKFDKDNPVSSDKNS